MDNHKFMFIKDGAITASYFIIKDSVHIEYSDDTPYAESIIKWKNCSEYSVIVKKIYYTEPGLQPGDTMTVIIQSHKKDTIIGIASAYNLSVPIKLLMTKID